VVSRRTPDGATTRWEYDEAGRVSLVVSLGGARTLVERTDEAVRVTLWGCADSCCRALRPDRWSSGIAPRALRFRPSSRCRAEASKRLVATGPAMAA